MVDLGEWNTTLLPGTGMGYSAQSTPVPSCPALEMNQRFGYIDEHLHWRAVDLSTEIGGNPVLLIVERIRVDDRMRWMALHGTYIREKLVGRKPQRCKSGRVSEPRRRG